MNCRFTFHIIFLAFVVTKPVHGASSGVIDFHVDLGEQISALNHFWESTGLCPPLPHQNASDYFLSEDMLQNIMLIGSLPHGGIKQVRMHWLLDMVTYNKATKSYNFGNLNLLLQRLDYYNLRPGFELMGSPSNKFTNFDDNDQVMDWMEFVTKLGQNFVKLFGLDKVSKWNFETWNEPDHKDFDNVTMTVEGFLKYYDACSEGLKSVDKSLIFGGPGGSCRKESFSQRCWALLEHCVSGTNYITGEKGSRIDFIAMHKKGAGSSDYILQTELETIEKMHALHPELVNVPIFNDEGDPMVGWSKPYDWRGDLTYPAMVAKIIAQHQDQIIANKSRHIVYSLLSNDNGFLSYSPHYFTQRTLLARFQMNNTDPHYVHFVRKPIYSVMALLSKLGDIQLNATSLNGEEKRVGTVASVCGTCASDEITLLTYASDDTRPTTDAFNIYLEIKNVNITGKGKPVLISCDLDDDSNNPMKLWKNSFCPGFPSNDVFRIMHMMANPRCSDPVDVNIDNGTIKLRTYLSLPGVTLNHICWKPSEAPGAPVIKSVHNITRGKVLITWSDENIKTKCIKTYEIEHCSDLSCLDGKMINHNIVILNSFFYIPTANEPDVIGVYRVRVVDFWDRPSSYSKPYVYPSKMHL